MDFTKTVVARRPKIMKAGDLAIIYERHDQLDHLYLRKGKVYDNRFGSFHHDDMIGKPFGSRIKSRTSHGFIYILEPTPELWSTAVHTRTQIVNEVDASVVTMMLDVFPGCKVVESGTGSGCMTLSLARAVYPNGHVYTYEYNGVRAETAREEFRRLKVDQLITVTHRDVCGKYRDEAEGGGFSGVAEKSIDSVFLDLPEPWLAIEHAKKILKPGRHICCYSPCIEQVMKGCDKLRELGFHSIRMIEVRQRPYDARVIDMETIDLGLNEAEEALNNKSVRDPINYHQHKISEKTVQHKPHQPQLQSAAPSSHDHSNDTKQEEEGASESDGEGKDEDEDDEAVGKKRKIAADNEQQQSQPLGDAHLRVRNAPRPQVSGFNTHAVARPLLTMKGHTAFLTFAIRSLHD